MSDKPLERCGFCGVEIPDDLPVIRPDGLPSITKGTPIIFGPNTGGRFVSWCGACDCNTMVD